jgi:Flp pilus assembly protein TadB
MPRRGRDEPEVYRITGVQQSHSDDQSQRIGRYLLSMLIRTVCLVLVLVIPGPIRWAFAVGAVILPYVAVVMANAGQAKRDGAPPTMLTHSPRAGLGPAPSSEPGSSRT